MKLCQSLEVFQASIGHLGCYEGQVLKLRQSLEVFQASIGDLATCNVQVSELWHVLEMCQSGVGDLTTCVQPFELRQFHGDTPLKHHCSNSNVHGMSKEIVSEQLS